MDIHPEDACRALADAAGTCVIRGDHSGLHALLEPRSRTATTPEMVGRMITEAGTGLPQPVAWTVDRGAADLTALRDAPADEAMRVGLVDHVSPENFRGWWCVQLLPKPGHPEDANRCFDLWFAAVEHGGSCHVAFFEAAEAT